MRRSRRSGHWSATPPPIQTGGRLRWRSGATRLRLATSITRWSGIAGRRLEYNRIIDRRDELKELRWHCPTTGGYQHWLLTDAQGGTFVDMEMGIKDPESSRFALFDKTVGRWFIKRWAEQAIDGLRRTLTSSPTS